MPAMLDSKIVTKGSKVRIFHYVHRCSKVFSLIYTVTAVLVWAHPLDDPIHPWPQPQLQWHARPGVTWKARKVSGWARTYVAMAMGFKKMRGPHSVLKAYGDSTPSVPKSQVFTETEKVSFLHSYQSRSHCFHIFHGIKHQETPCFHVFSGASNQSPQAPAGLRRLCCSFLDLSPLFAGRGLLRCCSTEVVKMMCSKQGFQWAKEGFNGFQGLAFTNVLSKQSIGFQRWSGFEEAS